MTPSELKTKLYATAPHFFSLSNMRFFGDTMRNFGVRKATVKGREAWELYRKRPVKHGLQTSHYFDATTFERVHV